MQSSSTSGSQIATECLQHVSLQHVSLDDHRKATLLIGWDYSRDICMCMSIDHSYASVVSSQSMQQPMPTAGRVSAVYMYHTCLLGLIDASDTRTHGGIAPMNY
jgi:hypothetical protein